MSNLYMQKPVVVEAFQMTKARRWDNSEWPNWLNEAWQRGAKEGGIWPNPDYPHVTGESPANLCIGTLRGAVGIDWDDWIIRSAEGELCLCSPDIFGQLYDTVLAEPPEMDGR